MSWPELSWTRQVPGAIEVGDQLDQRGHVDLGPIALGRRSRPLERAASGLRRAGHGAAACMPSRPVAVGRVRPAPIWLATAASGFCAALFGGMIRSPT